MVDGLRYWAYRAATMAVSGVPERIAESWLGPIGGLAWLTNRAGRRAVEANLAVVLGTRGARWRWCVRETFREGARAYYNVFRLRGLTCTDISELVVVHGWEHLLGALQAGRGAILAQPHFTGSILGGQVIACRGVPFTAPVEAVEPPSLLDLLTGLRAGLGMRAVPLGPRAPAVLARALRDNQVVGLLVDRDVAGTGITVPFFGRPARVPRGPARLSLRSGAPILPGVVVRRPDGRYDGYIEPPLALPPSGERVEAERALTRALTARLEYYIAANPEQWTVFQPIWVAAKNAPASRRVGGTDRASK